MALTVWGRQPCKEREGFWDKNAGRYDRFMRNDRAAYEKMYRLIRPVVKAKTVLEVATGTGAYRKEHRKCGGAHRGYGRFCKDDP